MKKRWYFACGIGIIALSLALCFYLTQHKGDQFISAVTNGQFYIEGELGYFANQPVVNFWHTVEYNTGTEYGIQNAGKTYYAVGSQYYYGENENSQRMLIPEEHNPKEIFSRESIFSYRDLSDLKFCCEGSDQIMNIETVEQIICHYEEYEFKHTGELIRLYFRGEQLYAIQAETNARYVLYVSVFSDDPQRYIDEMGTKE